MLLTGRIPGKALAAQALRGSGQHGLPPVLVWQGMLVAESATRQAGVRIAIIPIEQLLLVQVVILPGHPRLLCW